MGADILTFNGITTLDIDADRMLQNAIGELSEVIIIGYTKYGEEYFASSKADGSAVLWHLERAKKKLLEVIC
jgi:hypothetical protein